MTDAGGGTGGVVSGGGGGGGTARGAFAGGRGGVGNKEGPVDVEGGGTLFGGVVESGEWPDDGLVVGVGGKGGSPISSLLLRPGGVSTFTELEEEEAGVERFGIYVL